MTVNLNQNRTEILKAYSEVVDDKSDTVNWALFGYEGNSNVLKFVDKGDGGLDELIGSFNAAQVMYGLCAVEDNITKVSKFILINWQGEGVPTGRLGVCAPHLPEIRKIFKGVSLTYNARNEDDVEPETVKAFVCKTSSTFASTIRGGGGHSIADLDTLDPKPVGSVYSRVNPEKDINTKDRDKFWELTEQEEAKRVAAEQQRRAEEAKRMENENLRMQEAQARAELESEVDRERRTKSDQMRQLRLQEVQQMVGQRQNVREMWEKSADHNDNIKSPPPTKPKTTGARKWPPTAVENTHEHKEEPKTEITERSFNSQQKIDSSPQRISREEPITQPSIIGNGNKEVNQRGHESSNGPSILAQTIMKRQDSDSEQEESQDWEDSDAPPKMAPPSVPVLPEPMEFSTYQEIPIQQVTPDLGLCARALWDYQAADDGEISFEPEDIIIKIEKIDPGWWRGESPSGAVGLFPANYVELID